MIYVPTYDATNDVMGCVARDRVPAGAVHVLRSADEAKAYLQEWLDQGHQVTPEAKELFDLG